MPIVIEIDVPRHQADPRDIEEDHRQADHSSITKSRARQSWRHSLLTVTHQNPLEVDLAAPVRPLLFVISARAPGGSARRRSAATETRNAVGNAAISVPWTPVCARATIGRGISQVSLFRMYALQTEMTKLLEEVIERGRQLHEAVQEVSCARVLPADNCIFARKGD
jgi:hypothetical protein